MKIQRLGIILATGLLLTSCTAGPNPLMNTSGPNGMVAGFFNGFWDGSIAPITFVISLFDRRVGVFNPYSDGWYLFGFMLGIGALSSSSTSASRSK